MAKEVKQKTKKKSSKKEKRDTGKEEKEEDFDVIITQFTKVNLYFSPLQLEILVSFSPLATPHL